MADVLRNQFTSLFDLIQQRATEDELAAAVSSLNGAIATKVTQQELYDAVNNAVNTAVATTLPQTSHNTNGVAALDTSAYSYYDQWQLQSIIDKVNELINTLRRF